MSDLHARRVECNDCGVTYSPEVEFQFHKQGCEHYRGDL